MNVRPAALPLVHRAVAASVILAALVAATFGILVVAVSHLRASTNVEDRSRNATTATLGVEQVVNQLESSLRAFILSGNDRFIGQWRRADRAVDPTFARVSRLLVNQPAESRQAGQLSYLTKTYISEYGAPLINIYGVSPAAARAPVATREGASRINAIRTRLGRLLASEASLASSDAAGAKRQASTAVVASVIALVAAAALLVAYGVFLVRGIVGPAHAVAAGATDIAEGDLSTRLPERGAPEILALTSAFNAMARSLEQGKRELEEQNEQLRQSERLKSQLVSIVSHELRTPLTSILGYTRLLQARTFEKAEVDRYLEIIHQQGERLKGMIDHFLDAESVDTGKIELDDQEFDLVPLLVREVQLAADKTTMHSLTLDAQGEIPVRGDRDRVSQVFANLLNNAVKYSPDGGPVEVSAGTADGVVRVTVRDHGMGVPEGHQSRIFTKFFRGDARDSGIAGTGLGLAVSREIVEGHGGRMGFESSEGHGSEFWFELPCCSERDPLQAHAAAGTAGYQRRTSGSTAASDRLI